MTDEHQAEDPATALAAGFREVAKAPAAARQAARAEIARRWPAVALTNALLTVLIAAVFSVIGVQLLERTERTEAGLSALRTAAEQVKPGGDQANRELAEQGRPPVTIPDPGTAPDSEVITAAVTAKVLASIPAAEISPARLGQAIAEQLAASPPVVSSSAIAAQVAGYLATNPPAPGPPGQAGPPPACEAEPDRCRGPQGETGTQGPHGETGPAGPPPTAAQIQEAFAGFVQANPDLLRDTLCAGIGTWQEVALRSADGGTTTGYLCVTGTTEPLIPNTVR
ncbi:hypothetical protein [Amycolatopsis magusensis]|uniref:hypothetical protein n=1 Tax=Amycolatopsis magusensis TaxID=882444 RepID=UPI003C2B04B1